MRHNETVDGKIRGGRKKSTVVFIHLEKAFDRVPSEVIWWSLRKVELEREIKANVEIYANIETSVKMLCMRLELFDEKVDVH